MPILTRKTSVGELRSRKRLQKNLVIESIIMALSITIDELNP